MRRLRPNRFLLVAILACFGFARTASALSVEATLEKSTDLQTWTPVTVTTGLLDAQGRILQDPGSTGFYRLSLAAATPPAGTVAILSGSFLMGDALDGTSTAPVHSVSLSGYYIETNEVTKALWDEVRAWGLANGYTDLPIGVARASNHPVQTISWFAAVRWCNARSEKEGRTPAYRVGGAVYKTLTAGTVTCDWTANGYRLPTEAEWEKAARGGLSGKRFPWGDTISHANANYISSDLYAYDTGASSPPAYHPTYFDGIGELCTSPAGSFPANGAGLKDMAGNVAEWCWDWYAPDYYATSPATNPTGPATGTARVVRGGSWESYGEKVRVADRGIHDPALGNLNTVGFRCVLP